MQVAQNISDGKAVLCLSGRFDFSGHKDFRDAYEGALGDQKVNAITIDLASVDYLDSAALGMLLLLRDKAAGAHKSVALKGANGGVRQVLEVANFHKLFTLN
jgi:anti-anti-sigma factor